MYGAGWKKIEAMNVDLIVSYKLNAKVEMGRRIGRKCHINTNKRTQ